MDKIAFTYDDVRVTPDRQIGLYSNPQWELSHVNKYKCSPKTVRMNTIDTKLRTYVEQHIIPRYALFDKAHRAEHVNMVIEQSMKLASSMPGINKDMVYVTAAFHDLGLVNGRENHHIDSRKILEADEFIKAHFTQEQID